MPEASRPRLLVARAAAWLGGWFAFRSQRRTARLLYGFSRTEAQSQLELCRAAQVCKDVERRALYLRHGLDEARHARAFADHAARLSVAVRSNDAIGAAAGSEDLFERLGETRFLALVHLGERRGRMQFEVYARILRKQRTDDLARLFEQLVRDELQHEAYSARLLQELVGVAETQSALRWAARSEAWRAFRRHGRRTAGLLYAATMLVVYLALAPYALVFRLFSKPRRGLSSDA